MAKLQTNQIPNWSPKDLKSTILLKHNQLFDAI